MNKKYATKNKLKKLEKGFPYNLIIELQSITSGRVASFENTGQNYGCNNKPFLKNKFQKYSDNIKNRNLRKIPILEGKYETVKLKLEKSLQIINVPSFLL
ncbi:hypothetical protein MXB_1703 [Myxobolus squamalis]|nr:hypothetical protein MXB_1703 [Myxobolus squamalis]